MEKSSIALDRFHSYNCAQSVFSSFAEDLKLDKKTALKIASGFGGGMACAEICGAVTGAYMVIGMKHGHTNIGLQEKGHTKELIRKFNKQFISKHGSLKCKELLGCDISTNRGLKKAQEKDAFNEFCPQFVASACDLLEEEFLK